MLPAFVELPPPPPPPTPPIFVVVVVVVVGPPPPLPPPPVLVKQDHRNANALFFFGSFFFFVCVAGVMGLCAARRTTPAPAIGGGCFISTQREERAATERDDRYSRLIQPPAFACVFVVRERAPRKNNAILRCLDGHFNTPAAFHHQGGTASERPIAISNQVKSPYVHLQFIGHGQDVK